MQSLPSSARQRPQHRLQQLVNLRPSEQQQQAAAPAMHVSVRLQQQPAFNAHDALRRPLHRLRPQACCRQPPRCPALPALPSSSSSMCPARCCWRARRRPLGLVRMALCCTPASPTAAPASRPSARTQQQGWRCRRSRRRRSRRTRSSRRPRRSRRPHRTAGCDTCSLGVRACSSHRRPQAYH